MIPQFKIDMYPETTEDRLRRELAEAKARLSDAEKAAARWEARVCELESRMRTIREVAR